MAWDSYGDTDVAELEDEYTEEREERRRSKMRLERSVCPSCRMLLSVIETRMGRCRNCGWAAEVCPA